MRKLSLRSFTSFLIARWTKPSPITTKCRKDSARPFSRTTSAKPSNSCPAAAAIAASPTSTSAPAAPKSAAPSAAKKRPAAGVKAAVTPGKPTCVGKPSPSTTPKTCPWRRELRLAETLSLDFLPGWLHPIGMNLILSPHNVTLTKAIEDHLISRINKLDHNNNKLNTLNVHTEARLLKSLK